MALNIATFKTRTISALIFAAIMLVGLLWNRWSFFCLFSLIHFGCWKEFQLLIGQIDKKYAGVPWAWRIGFPLLGWGGMWWALRDIPPVPEALVFAGYVGDGLIGAGLVLIVTGIVLRPSFSMSNIWYALAGLVYISLPWFAMILLRGIGQDLLSMSQLFSGDPGLYHRIVYPAALPCALVFSIWINDTMAYLVGSLIGRTPFSKISPKKTWEGTAGGAILCVALMAVIGHYVGIYREGVWLAIAAIAAIAGTAGDLLESRLKRLAGVKDSGRILPGHGGFLDRFDSLLLATPLVYAYLLVVGL
jgi:phosphatidate cytidylyltransferase